MPSRFSTMSYPAGAMQDGLRTERLRLRLLTMDDFDFMSQIEAGFVHRKYLRGIDDPRRRQLELQRTIAGFAERGYGLLGIKYADAPSELIGYCGLLPYEVPDAKDLEPEAKDVEIVCSVLQRHWNQGVGTEACERVLTWGLEELGLPQVFGRVADENESSKRLVQRLGMTLWNPHTDFLTGTRELVYIKGRSGNEGRSTS